MPSPMIAACSARQRDAEIGQHEVDVEQLHDDRDAADHVDDAPARIRREHARCRRRASAPRPGRARSTAASEPIVTMIVSFTPCSRMGRNSTSRRAAGSALASSAWRTVSRSRPFRPHFARIFSTVPFAFSFASDALILPSSSRVALAHADADRADDGRLVALDQAQLGEIALLQIVGKDRIVGEAGLQAAGVHVAQDVRNGVVDLDLAEQARSSSAARHRRCRPARRPSSPFRSSNGLCSPWCRPSARSGPRRRCRSARRNRSPPCAPA